MEKQEGHSRNDLMDFARSQMRNTIFEARDAIWNLRQPDQSAESLGDKIESMTVQIGNEFGTQVEFARFGTPFAVRQPVVHDLLMVTREAVLNAILHGKAQRVKVGLSYARGAIAIRIADNGCGFEVSQVESRDHHFGLRGMRERAQRCGGTFHLHTEPGKGVRIEVQLPEPN